MASLPIEIKFAQSLAGNEKKLRYKAVKKLKKYLRAKSASKKDGFNADDLLKIWKGLHYCMWMQDKPLLQEELSTTLTQLVHDLSTVDAQMLFIKVFFITQAREWNSIDVWRIDKFMMLVRNMLYESLMVVKKLKWDPTHLDQLAQIFGDVVMNPDSDMIPDGLKIHFSDMYLEEVEKVGDGQLTGPQLLKLLVPFIKFMQKAKNIVVLKRVISRVFDPVITRVVDGETLKQTQNDGDDDEEETSEVPFMSLKFDSKLISDHMFDVSQQDCVLSRNRPLLYEIVRKLQDIQKGVLPQEKQIGVSAGVTYKDVRQAVHSLKTLDEQKKRKKKKPKKKNKNPKPVGDSEANENADPNNNSSAVNVVVENQVQSTSSKIGGKRKHSLTEDGGDEPLTKLKKKKLESKSSTKDIANEKKTFKKLKNKLTKLDVLKGKKAKKLETAASDKTPTSQSVKKGKSGSVKKSVLGTPVTVEKLGGKVGNKTEDTVEESTPKSQVPLITIRAEVPSSLNKSTERRQLGTPKKKGKRAFSQSETGEGTSNAVSSSKSPGPSANKVPEIVLEKVNTPEMKSPAKDSDVQDGEIEIWVPNKKYKGNKDSTPKSNFATFDQSKPPVAFVKRSLSKLKKTPNTLKTPGSSRTPDPSKRVSFDMKKNKAQGFKESLNSPLTPFNPAKKPDNGILKSPGPASPWTTTGQGSSKGTAKNSNSSLQTPVTRQATQKAVTKNRSHMTTPVVSVGFERKKATPMKRLQATDFYL